MRQAIFRTWSATVALFLVSAVSVADPIPPVTVGALNFAGHAAGMAVGSGPDGNLWLTIDRDPSNPNVIAKLTPGGVYTAYSIPTANSTPSGITAGPDGAMWFTEFDGNKIGRITSDGQITEFPLPANSFPDQITAGPIWNLRSAPAVGAADLISPAPGTAHSCQRSASVGAKKVKHSRTCANPRSHDLS